MITFSEYSRKKVKETNYSSKGNFIVGYEPLCKCEFLFFFSLETSMLFSDGFLSGHFKHANVNTSKIGTTIYKGLISFIV